MKKKFNFKKFIVVIISILLVVLCIVLISFLVKSDNSKKEVSFTNSTKRRATEISNDYDEVSNKAVVKLKNENVTDGGSYELSGNYNCITINSPRKVNLFLNNVSINCDDGPGIYVENASSVNVVLKGENSVVSNTNLDLGGAIYSMDDLILSGDGSLNVSSNFDGIVSRDKLVIKSGNYDIYSAGDGIKGKDVVAIVSGNFIIDSKEDGIKSTNIDSKAKGYITIDDGDFNITSLLDGIQAETDVLIKNGNYSIKTGNESTNDSSKGIKANDLIEISDGTFLIESEDDCIHSDDLIVDNGTFNMVSNDDGIKTSTLLINSGVFIINAVDGIKTTYFRINNGTVNVNAKDDGIAITNDEKKYNPTFEINNGTINVEMGAGSSAGISCPGSFIIHDGTVSVKGDLPFNISGEVVGDGGSVFKNGRQIENISSLAPKRRGSSNSTNKDNSSNNENSEKDNTNTRTREGHESQKKDR